MAFAPGGNRGTPEAPQTAGLDRPTLSRAAYRPRCANLLSESQMRWSISPACERHSDSVLLLSLASNLKKQVPGDRRKVADGA